MTPTKFIQQEVEADIEDELNRWCYDSHLWDKQKQPSVSTYQCRWCGHCLYSELNFRAFEKPCPENPRIKGG